MQDARIRETEEEHNKRFLLFLQRSSLKVQCVINRRTIISLFNFETKRVFLENCNDTTTRCNIKILFVSITIIFDFHKISFQFLSYFFKRVASFNV